MQLAIESSDGELVHVRVTGTIREDDESPTDEPLGNLLGRQAYSQKVLLDLSNAEFLNSNGVGWLLVCHKRLREEGGRMILHSIPPMIQNVLKLMRMELVFELADDSHSAARAIQGEVA